MQVTPLGSKRSSCSTVAIVINCLYGNKLRMVLGGFLVAAALTVFSPAPVSAAPAPARVVLMAADLASPTLRVAPQWPEMAGVAHQWLEMAVQQEIATFQLLVEWLGLG